jgi:hypothetical protein
LARKVDSCRLAPTDFVESECAAASNTHHARAKDWIWTAIGDALAYSDLPRQSALDIELASAIKASRESLSRMTMESKMTASGC